MRAAVPYCLEHYSPPFDEQEWQHREVLKLALRECLDPAFPVSIAPATAAAFALIAYARKSPSRIICVRHDHPDTIISLVKDAYAKMMDDNREIASLIEREEWDKVPADLVYLSPRASQVIIQTGCETVSDILSLSDVDILRVPNSGRVTLALFHNFQENPSDYL